MDSMNEVFMANDPMHAEIMEEYYRKKKSVGTAYFFWFCFGLHYVYLNNPIKFIFYFFTAGLFGLWALLDLFRMSSLVSEYNFKLMSKLSKKARQNRELAYKNKAK